MKNRLNKCAETGKVEGISSAATPASTPTTEQTATATAAPEKPSVEIKEQQASNIVTLEQPKQEISEAAKNEAISQGLKVSENTKAEVAGGDAKGGGAAQTIRVNLTVLEGLMQMVSELVLTRNQLIQMSRNIQGEGETDLASPLQRLNHITTDLQEGIMKTRMQPISNAWSKFPRLIRDLSLELGKKVDLKMIGEETEIDRQMLEMIKDPLTHMVRNSADHGLEQPEERRKAGKNEVGTVTLSAAHEGGHIIIKIADDGRGINIERVKQKAIENGIATEAEIANMPDQQIFQFIFKPGFSTAAKVTAVSGRGVGMDVVKTNIEKIGGTVELISVVGKGSTFLIKIPLTLAIMPVLIVECRNEKYAIPQIRINEVVRISKKSRANKGNELDSQIETLNDAPVLRLRDKLLPLASLAKTLNLDSVNYNVEKDNFIVVCQVGSSEFGVIVDKVFHTEEIVVKPVSPPIKNISVYSGTTILGDGSVIMILDTTGIIKSIGADILSNADSDHAAAKKSIKGDGQRASFLIFSCGDKSPKSVPLELVSRLEEIDFSKVEWSGGSQVVQYRDDLMRLVSLDSSTIPQSGTHPVIVFSDENKVMGLVVKEILDIVENDMNIKMSSGSQGLLGGMVINGKTTDLIDVSFLFSKHFNDWLEDKNKLDSAGSSNNKHILLIDDSPFFRKFMKPILTVANYRVTTCESAVKALEILNMEGPVFDLIVTDIDMPGMNGIEFTNKCKNDEKYKKIPIVALTSYTSGDVVENSKSLGFSGYISKANRDTLVQKISEVLAA